MSHETVTARSAWVTWCSELKGPEQGAGDVAGSRSSFCLQISFLRMFSTLEQRFSQWRMGEGTLGLLGISDLS